MGRTIKIFLASADELKPERDCMAALANSLSSALLSQDINVVVVKWEDLDSSMSHSSKQDEYNAKLSDCEICVVLFWKSLGKHTKVELDTAYSGYKAGNNPKKLYVCFKDCPDPSDELKQFKDSFSSRYNSTYIPFNNIDALKAHFLLQFFGYIGNVADVSNATEIRYGKVIIDGKEYTDIQNGNGNDTQIVIHKLALKAGWAKFEYGLALYQCGKADDAMAAYQDALSLADKQDKDCYELQAECYNHIGNYYSDMKKLDKALAYYDKAQNLWKSINGEYHPNVARSYNNIGNVYSKKGDHKKALECHEKALQIKKRELGNNAISTAISLQNIGRELLSMNDVDAAEKYFREAYQVYCSKLGYNHSYSLNARKDLLKIALERNDYREIIDLFLRQAEEGDSFMQFGIAMLYEFGLGGVEKDIDKALCFYQKAARQGNEEACEKVKKLLSRQIIN